MNAAKDVIRARLHLVSGPGHMRFPHDPISISTRALASERSVVKMIGSQKVQGVGVALRPRERGARLPGVHLCPAVRAESCTSDFS